MNQKEGAMRYGGRRLVGFLVLGVVFPVMVSAQTKEISVAYLRAAAGAIGDRSSVQLTAVFVRDPGLVEATGNYLRGKGFCRFSVKDPGSGVVFSSMYCRQDSQAFKELINAGAKTYRMSGYKDYGEQNEPAIIVTGVEAFAEKGGKVSDEKSTRTFRVIIRSNSSSNRTELANAVLGQVYSVAGITFQIEEESASAGGGSP
jgi:hypothetical protein